MSTKLLHDCWQKTSASRRWTLRHMSRNVSCTGQVSRRTEILSSDIMTHRFLVLMTRWAGTKIGMTRRCGRLQKRSKYHAVNGKKQGDPLTKPGLIGAFCRAHTIEDAIETFLSDEYTACAAEGRYTYTKGSTSAGLVVYDDKFAYSHHSTDPAGGKLCNAFDLVRLHKFGVLDADAAEGTPGS